MNNKEIEKIKLYINKSKESFEEAKLLFDEKHFASSVSKSYYSVFYAVSALLLTKGLEFSKHSAVISAFGKEFVKEGIFPRDYQKILIKLFENREIADYDIYEKIDKDFASKDIEKAREFIDNIFKYLKTFFNLKRKIK